MPLIEHVDNILIKEENELIASNEEILSLLSYYEFPSFNGKIELNDWVSTIKDCYGKYISMKESSFYIVGKWFACSFLYDKGVPVACYSPFSIQLNKWCEEYGAIYELMPPYLEEEIELDRINSQMMEEDIKQNTQIFLNGDKSKEVHFINKKKQIAVFRHKYVQMLLNLIINQCSPLDKEIKIYTTYAFLNSTYRINKMEITRSRGITGEEEAKYIRLTASGLIFPEAFIKLADYIKKKPLHTSCEMVEFSAMALRFSSHFNLLGSEYVNLKKGKLENCKNIIINTYQLQ